MLCSPSIAAEAVARIAQIYAVERDVRGASADARRATRLVPRIGRSSPLIETAKLSNIDPQPWLADCLTRLVNPLPNNRLAPAMGLDRRAPTTAARCLSRVALALRTPARQSRPHLKGAKRALTKVLAPAIERREVLNSAPEKSQSRHNVRAERACDVASDERRVLRSP
jgi:hypothetical protein